MEAILGGVTVINGKGESIPLAAYTGAGKTVGLYFSAHWCPPCRGFTPTLAEFYNKVKATPKGADFEIVFVSCDRDDASFKSYFESMPWLALSFADSDRKSELSEKFSVSGIPAFIILNGADGVVKDNQGRGTVGNNKDGTFPSNW